MEKLYDILTPVILYKYVSQSSRRTAEPEQYRIWLSQFEWNFTFTCETFLRETNTNLEINTNLEEFKHRRGFESNRSGG